MIRVLKYVGLLIVILILLVLLTVLVAPKTPVGQAIIDHYTRPLLVRVVKEHLGSDLSYARPRGALPGELILEDVVLSNDAGPWLEVDEAYLRWSPFALLRRKVELEELRISRTTFYRLPVLPEREASTEESEEESDDLFRLPHIEVKQFAMSQLSIGEAVFGERYVLNLTADGYTQGRNINARVNLDTEAESDLLNLLLRFNGRELELIAQILSRPDGLISTLAEADGAVWLSLKGAGALSDWQGKVEADLGAYGSLGGLLNGDLKRLEDANVQIRALPGPKLPEQVMQFGGEEIFFSADAQRTNGSVLLNISSFEGRFGNIAGTVTAETGTRALQTRLSGTLSETLLQEFDAEMLAGAFTLDGTVKPFAPDNLSELMFDADLTVPIGRLQVINAQTRSETPFVGQIDLSLSDIPYSLGPLQSLAAKGGRLRTNLRLTSERQLSLTDLQATLGASQDELSLMGQADIGLSDQKLNSRITLRATPTVIALLTDNLILSGPLTLRANAQGAFDQFSLQLDGDYPDGMMQDISVAAGQLSAELTSLPQSPSGSLRIKARDDSYQGVTRMTSRETLYTVEELSFSTSGLTVKGAGRYDTASGAANVTAKLDAPEGTTLITGHEVAGSLNLKASYQGADRPITAEVTATDLIAERFSARHLKATAKGSPSSLAVNLDTTDAAIPNVYVAQGTVAATLDLMSDTKRINLSTLDLYVDEIAEEQRIRLTSPMTLSIGETIEATKTEIDWLRDGVVTLSGGWSPRRWKADITANRIELPGFQAPFEADVRLDTDAPQIADVNISATTQNEQERDVLLTANGHWDGQIVRLRTDVARQNARPILNLDVQHPLTLTRAASGLGINLPETGLDGTLTIDGPIDEVYSFLPDLPVIVAGRIVANVQLGGALTDPTADGSIRFIDSRFEDRTIGTALEEINGDITLQYGNGNTAATAQLTATDLTGRRNAVRFSADASIGGEESRIEGTLNLDQATLVKSRELEVVTSGDLALTGPLKSPKLAGTIDIRKLIAEIPALTSNGSSTKSYTPVDVTWLDAPEDLTERENEPAKSTITPLTLDLKIRGRNAIIVRGRGLESEWSTDMSISGTASSPNIAGIVNVVDGTFDFAGRKFDITKGQVAFAGNDPSKGLIDFEAAYETDETTALLQVSGTVGNPTITLSSNPPIPQEDVMALILFGKNPTQLSAIESLQIATEIAQLTGAGGMGGSGLTGTLRNSIGLDALSLGVDPETGQGTVAVGKYLSDDLYVSAQQSAGEVGTEITVTYEVSDKITVETTLKPDGAQSVSANYKKDY